jgi:hypothetical protein
VKDLEVVFAKTHHALAKAVEAQGKKKAEKTGRFLKSAAIHLEHGLSWSGHKLEAAAVASIKEIRVLSGKLIEGTGWGPDEIGKAIKWIGKEIEKLGSKIEGNK